MTGQEPPTAPSRHRVAAAVLGLWAVVLAPVLLLDILVIIAFVVALRSEAQATMMLEVLRVSVAWPMVVLAVAVAFGLAFRPEIGDALKRLVIKVANVEIGTRQVEETARILSAGAPSEAAEGPAVAAVPSKSAEHAAEAKPGAAEVTPNQDAELARLRELSAVRMRYWWWWWLQVVQLRLAPRTVLALRWLLEQPGGAATMEGFDQRFRPTLPLESADVELNAMLTALLQFGLVVSPPSRATITITDSGRKFLNFLDGTWKPLEDQTIT